MASPKGRRRRRAARAAKIAAEAAQANVTEVVAKEVVEPTGVDVTPPEPAKKASNINATVTSAVASRAKKLKERLTTKS